jgi:hypothetical protein
MAAVGRPTICRMSDGTLQATGKQRLLGGVTGKGWKPGQSGNARGRPKIPFDLPAACREHAAAAVQVLVDALHDPKNKIEAAKVLLDRGFGKAPVVIEGEAAATLSLMHLIAARHIAAELQEAFLAGRSMPPPDERQVIDFSNPTTLQHLEPALE